MPLYTGLILAHSLNIPTLLMITPPVLFLPGPKQAIRLEKLFMAVLLCSTQNYINPAVSMTPVLCWALRIKMFLFPSTSLNPLNKSVLLYWVLFGSGSKVPFMNVTNTFYLQLLRVSTLITN